MIDLQNKDEECFKWVVNEALHHEETEHHPERISLLRPYENQYNWEGLEFLLSIKKIDRFQKNNPGIVVNVLFNNKKSPKEDKYTVCRLERNMNCKNSLT